MNLPRTDDTMMAEINITPFTDVLLVLLIIFMILAAMLQLPGFQKSLPSCGTHCKQSPHMALTKKIELFITQGGRMYVDTQPVNDISVYPILAVVAGAQKHPRLNITADGKARYGLVIRALDAAKAAGIDDVTLVSQ